MANNGSTKSEIIEYVKTHFDYEIFDSEEGVMRFIQDPNNAQTELARVTMPVSLSAFLQGDSFESVLRLAVYFGVDTDTVAAISGSIAAALYGIPREIAEEATHYIPKDLLDVINKYDHNNLVSKRITPSSLRNNGINSIVVYGTNEDKSECEKGQGKTVRNRHNRNPLDNYTVRTIGTSIETLKNDIQNLITKVESEPNNLFYITDLGISEKSNRGIELMAQLLEPLKDKDNVYLWKDFWNYYNSYQK